MTNEAKPDPHVKLVGTEHTITPGNPFADLAKLRQSQDYEEFLGGEAVTKLNVRTLKEDMHLRVNPDPNYSLLGQYVIPAQAGRGTYFVFPQFRDALGALPRRCNLHIAVDGHGEYFLLLIKQANPYIKVEHKMFKPDWPTKPMEELLYNAFPDMVVNSLSHDLILQFKERGA
jgi:hypothetical protein